MSAWMIPASMEPHARTHTAHSPVLVIPNGRVLLVIKVNFLVIRLMFCIKYEKHLVVNIVHVEIPYVI